MPRQLPPDPDILEVCRIIGLDPETALAGSLTVTETIDEPMRVTWTGVCAPDPDQAQKIRAVLDARRARGSHR